jgi:two-component system, OmpR family, phosphate regulon sensor histidine kinase PhoR
MTDQPQDSPIRIAQRPDTKGKALLSLAIVFAVAWFALWFAGLILPPQSLLSIRERAFGLGFILAAGSASLWGRHVTRAQRKALQYFDQLSRMDAQELSHAATSAETNLPPTNPWFAVTRNSAERFGAVAERLRESEQARAALEIRLRRNAARQKQLETILVNLPEPVLAINAFDELVLANSSAEKLFEIEEKTATGKPLARLLKCERLVDLLIETRRRKAPAQRTAEAELVDGAGNSRWFAMVARSLALDDRGGAFSKPSPGAFAVLRDISELKTGQKRYAEFVSAVSHEMKSPLSGIKAYVELLADCDPADSTTREDFLNVIDSQANRLQRLIDNLLNIARIEAGVVEVSKKSISLNELLGEALDIVRPSAEAKHIRLAAEFSPMYLAVLADRDMLTQAAINLLSNAIKYTPEGGAVALRSRMIDDEIAFEVNDTGVGLSEEDKVKVFEKFYRVKKDRGMAQGTGLGLPLAKHIVEDVHGGRIAVESTPGAGSVFTVSLPAAAQLV